MREGQKTTTGLYRGWLDELEMPLSEAIGRRPHIPTQPGRARPYRLKTVYSGTVLGTS